MKALVYTDTLELQYRDEPEPSVGDGEALVKIEAIGICGSDMHAYHGHDARRVPPLILGHEAVGVVQTGSHRDKRVVLNPLITCGHCNHCLGGRSNLCAERELIGMRRAGAFADYISIPEGNLLDIPADMDSITASLTEPAATSLHAIYLAEQALYRPVSECNALILGAGSIGVFAALMLKHKGCGSIFLGDTNALRRATAEAANCGTVYDPLGDELPPQASFDLVIDAVGSGRSRAAASALVAAGGVISHVGLLDNEPGLDTRRLTLDEIAFLGNYTYSVIDLRAAIGLLYCRALGDLAWVESRSLANGAQAFRDIHEGNAAAAKIVLTP
ncbi:MAG TPA: alcohol dehydrogenase catalytic domain-containing protein [Gammaproteobacteria bacterium]|nr:alcohol dehydrogenase catalytic domain-containing protein [Gammaproteobacteria bacterium]